MRSPRKKFRDIPSQQFPSLLGSFIQPQSSPAQLSSPRPQRQIEDGIELVPIERQVTSCAKFLAPGQEEKEVVSSTQPDVERAVKPLPSLPKSKWSRMPVKYRILAILCIQISTVLTIGLSLLSIKSRTDARIDTFEAPVATSTPTTPIVPTPPDKVRGGTFALLMSNTQEESSSCLSEVNETAAWTCYPQTFQIDMLPPSMGETNQPFLLLKSLQDPNSTIYGPSDILQTDNITMNTTMDPDNYGYGWAYYFRTTYNRTVLIEESRMGQSERLFNDNPTPFTEVAPGDRPWWCLFPEVTIEGYIYVTRNTTTVPSAGALAGEEDENVSLDYLPYVMRFTEWYDTDSTPPQCSRMMMQDNGTIESTTNLMNLTLNKAVTMSRAIRKSDLEKLPGSKRQQQNKPNTCRCQWMIQ